MTIYLTWYDDTRDLLVITFEETWDVKDLKTVIFEASTTIRGRQHPVDVIADMRHSDVRPAHIFSTTAFVERAYATNTRTIVIIGADAYWMSIVRLYKQIARRAPRNIHFADTLSDAVTICREVCPRYGQEMYQSIS